MAISPCTLWLTGLSGAGKSTLAELCVSELRQQGLQPLLIDGDQLRAGLCADLGYSPEARRENIRRAAQLAALANDQGLVVVAALISPLAADRALACQVIGSARFIEVYVATPLQVCEQRDVKGLYRRARAGELQQFTGISAPYEAPLQPRLRIDTSVIEPALGAAALRRLLEAEA